MANRASLIGLGVREWEGVRACSFPRDGKYLPVNRPLICTPTRPEFMSSSASFYQSSKVWDTIPLPWIFPRPGTRKLELTLTAYSSLKSFQLSNPTPSQLLTLPCSFLFMKTHSKGFPPPFPLTPFAFWLTLVLLCVALHDMACPLLLETVQQTVFSVAIISWSLGLTILGEKHSSGFILKCKSRKFL